MKRADIKVGESYAGGTGYPLYGAKVRVLEVGVAESPYRPKPDKVRVVIERNVGGSGFYSATEGTEKLVATRRIVSLWSAENDARADAAADRNRRRKAMEDRVRAIGWEGLRFDYSGRLTADIDAAERLLDKAGF